MPSLFSNRAASGERLFGIPRHHGCGITECGPDVMRGYRRAPAATAEVLDTACWFNTRDSVRFEAEIEAALNVHLAVLQSAVVGRPVEGNEEIVAFGQPAAGAPLTEQELADHVAARMASGKQPSVVVLVDAMPRTRNGKILRRDLQSSYRGRTILDRRQPSHDCILKSAANTEKPLTRTARFVRSKKRKVIAGVLFGA